MSVTEKISNKGHGFFSPEEFAIVKASFSEFSGTTEYLALERYYHLANESPNAPEKQVPVKLFQDVFESLLRQKATPVSPSLREASAGLKQYASRLSNTAAMLPRAAKFVPKIMHFVWVGGSEVGAIQRDYMNIWRKVLAPEGYTFNLWYDSDALLAFEMNRVILESSRVHAMESGGDLVTDPVKLSRMIEDRARVSKRQMADFLNQPLWAVRADEARIDLMVRAYGKDRAVLEKFRQKCLDTHLEIVGQDLRLRDVRHEFADHYLKDVYQREVAMRGNFAAASDVVRLQAEYLEGGRYSDMDYLPPLANNLGGVDISGYSEIARLGVLQLLLNHHDALMPGREPQRYPDRTDKIPAGDKEALIKFARSQPALLEIFVPPQDSQAPKEGFRMAIQVNSEMNSYFIAHPDGGMTESIMQIIRFNYDCLHEVEHRLLQDGKHWGDTSELLDTIQKVLVEKGGEDATLTHSRRSILASLGQAIFEYYQDGIRIGARGTITLTGPGAAVIGLEEYTETHLTFEDTANVRGQLKLTDGYNVATEEEKISGWTVNAEPLEWLAKEQEKWKSGKLKTRYAANMAELLREQTLTFKQGWPVIEGKPVLQTSILQQLLNDLGKPFIQAMNDKLSGDISFKKYVAISFEQRQGLLAQPARELPLSVGAEPFGNLNEVLTRIAGNKLPVEQLSPLHRVVLGGLFGATTLDNEGFANAWEATRMLAVNTQDRGLAARYELIEQALREHNPQAFERSLSTQMPPTEGAQSSRVLKAQVFAEPLSVLQWGESIGRIQAAAKEEYQASILQKGHRVRAQFYQAGAVSAKQLPQGLLVRGNGDPGRRCYPLALVMGAALEKGHAAERALIGKLANANVPVADAETHALLRTLDELRSIPMAQFGEKLGAAQLTTVMQTLEANTTSSILMLNTDNHSMLVAKVVEQGVTSWRFYDPNFGMYTFQRRQDLQKGLEGFLADRTIAGLYGLAQGSDPTFNLIELDGSKIAAKVLPSHVMVGALLRSEAIAGGRTIEPWQHHAALRARSLSENARLGRSLAELDGRGWARQFEQAMTRLRDSHSLGRDYVPLLETVNAEPSGEWSVSLIDIKDPQNVVRVTVKDSRLFKIKTWLHERFNTLAGSGSEHAPGEPPAVNTLNAGFAIQALLNELHDHEDTAQRISAAPLATAVRLHGYVIYAQLIHGNLADIAGVIKLVRQALMNERVIAETTSSVVGRTFGRVAGEGAGTVLALANVGFDIYELANADNSAQRARAGTQLTFDLAGLVLSGVALAVGGTVGAFAGPLAIVVAGVGYGVSALVSNYSAILEKAQQVGLYFDGLKRGYGLGGHSLIDGIVHPMSDVVITTLDLRNRMIEFGSQALFPEHRNGPGLPDYYGDISKAINIREGWGLPGQALIAGGPGDEPADDYSGDRTVSGAILPCTPLCYFGYEYQLMPGAVNRHDKGFDVARELEFDAQGNRQFYFTPWTPFEYVVYTLRPVYKPTTVTVLLDKDIQSLYVAQIPLEWRGLITYDIEGVEGQCSLSLNPGVAAVRLMTTSADSPMHWVLRAPWVGEEAVIVDPSGLRVDGIDVQVAAGTELHIQLAGGQMFAVDWVHKQLVLEEQEIEDAFDSRLLQEHLAKLAHEHRLASPYVPLHNFSVPFADPAAPIRTNGFYEAAKDRVLYARNLPAAVCADIQLGVVSGDDLYFYHREHQTIWRVDAVTGQVTQRYRLLNPVQGSTIIACQNAGAAIRVVQQVMDRDGILYRMDYLLSAEGAHLCSIETTVDDVAGVAGENFVWGGWAQFLTTFDLQDSFEDASTGMADSIEHWTPATFVAMQVRFKQQRHTAWVRISDNWLLWNREVQTNGWVLLMPSDTDGDSVLFYDDAQHILWRWTRGTGDNPVLVAALSELKSMVAVAGGYLALTREGLLFDVGNDGVIRLQGLNEQWLGAHPSWLTELPDIAGQYSVDSFSIVGLSNADGLAMSAWYQDRQLLLVDPAHGQDLQRLGSTPDKHAAWFFARGTGRLYRQACLPIEQLQTAIGDDKRLLHNDVIPALQAIWPQWCFVDIAVSGAGLQGWTHDGICLELLDGEPATITGVDKRFFPPQVTRQEQESKLRRLIDNQRYALALRVGREGEHFTWYDTSAGRLFTTGGRFDGRWSSYLGTRDRRTFLLYDPIGRLLHSDKRDVWLMPSVVQRDAAVLTLETDHRIDDLLPLIPDEITTLVLASEQGVLTCRLTAQVWERLDCIIVECGRLQDAGEWVSGLLTLETGAQDVWQVNLIEGHLLLADPDSGRSLVLRDAQSMHSSLALSLQVLGGTIEVTLDELVLAMEGVDAQGLALMSLVERLNDV